MTAFRCDGVSKRFGTQPVLSDLSLTVPQGSVTAVLGASGSGKTTLLRLIMGFVRADSGHIQIGDTIVSDVPNIHVAPHRRAIGYVAQEGALFPHLTVAQNVAFGLDRGERKAGSRVGEMLDLVGLGDGYAGRAPHELSGGEQQRVALARALAPHPAMVLLDEPFSGLDAALRAETRRAVLGALETAGATTLLVTHDQAEALSMGKEVAILRDGHLVQVAPPADVYQTPVDLDVARFVGEAVVIAGTATGGSVSCVLGVLPLRRSASGAVMVMIRPEQVRMSDDVSSNSPLTATVVRSTYFGRQSLVTLRLNGGSGETITGSWHRPPPTPGSAVGICIDGPVVAYPPTGDR